MKCNKFRQNIVLDLYGELTAKDKSDLERHMAVCPGCAKDFAYSKNVFEALEEVDKEDIPEPQWDASWTKIDSAIKKESPRWKYFPVFPKWAYAAAGVLVIFFLGIFTGRLWIPTAIETVQTADTFQDDFQRTLSQHFEELKPVLLQMANYTAEENGNGTVLLDRQALQSLIIQNILLKSLIAGQNPTAEQILEDVELVLRELANMDEEDSRTKSMVKELIEEREILLNMKILQKT